MLSFKISNPIFHWMVILGIFVHFEHAFLIIEIVNIVEITMKC